MVVTIARGVDEVCSVEILGLMLFFKMPRPFHVTMLTSVVRYNFIFFLHDIKRFWITKMALTRSVIKIISVEGIRIPKFAISSMPFPLMTVSSMRSFTYRAKMVATVRNNANNKQYKYDTNYFFHTKQLLD